MEQRITVLIIEDDPDIRHYFESVIEAIYGKKVHLVFALSLKGGFEIFHRLYNTGLDLIFIDACLNSQQPNSMPLIKHMVEFYSGPLYAMSCNKHYVQPLLDAGCNGFCAKRELPHRIEEFLQEELKAS